MSDPMVFVQARMASTRFPGKALAPLAGKPVIEHVLDRVAKAVSRDRIVLCTTRDYTDEPLARFVRDWCFIRVYRGPTKNVVKRFQACLARFPCERFFRVCGDSPLLDPGLFARLLIVEQGFRDAADGSPDLVTNVFPRTFPKGQSLELIRSDTFAALDPTVLTQKEREHPTKVFYDNPSEFSIVNVTSRPSGVHVDMAVDTIEDLRQIEAML